MYYYLVSTSILSLKMHVSSFCLVMNARIGNISRFEEMPMNYSLFTEPFDIWGFDYMGFVQLLMVKHIYQMLIMVLSG